MRIASIEWTIVSIPYDHQEVSSQVSRDGVTDIVVKVTTDTGIVGWGEACAGADVFSVAAAIDALTPFVIGRDPWSRSAIHGDALFRGIWNFREQTFAFAYAGIDMALWDICGKAVGRPVRDLLGGIRRRGNEYFWYLPGAGETDVLEASVRDGVDRGYRVFYLKVGTDIERDEARVALVRRVAGPDARIRVDANGAWSVAEATRNLARLDRFDLDFAEQPVPADPVEGMLEIRGRSSVPIAANEGLWRVSDAWTVIQRRAADVLVFSPYWVGTIELFARLAWAGSVQGMATCKHTHGELGIAAAAAQEVLLTLPRTIEGHQQTAVMLQDDVLRDPIPIARDPWWGVTEAPLPGLGVEVDESRVAHWHAHFLEVGQYLPWARESLAAEDPEWQTVRLRHSADTRSAPT